MVIRLKLELEQLGSSLQRVVCFSRRGHLSSTPPTDGLVPLASVLAKLQTETEAHLLAAIDWRGEQRGAEGSRAVHPRSLLAAQGSESERNERPLRLRMEKAKQGQCLCFGT
ncbi:unnamed protein product [Pleuronectes platessa]|uniref:Uncharacterized protein n=1 Tax=Pleuronectes platessa TaxID=8262 RepID=A0A9N7TQJ2_PLEPL|nr:unnamed protein product [Pleuronectes platessa]